MNYEHGKTLSKRLGEGFIPEADLRSILSGVLDGLEVIHDRAILHRDLKPNNVVLREDGAPVIIDFGAARDFQARHSRSITTIATAGYAPPEQYGVGQQGPWSDLYALGAIAYRAVTGTAPVISLQRLRTDPLVPATQAARGRYDPALLGAIDWMMMVDETQRATSVHDVRAALAGDAGPKSSNRESRPTSAAINGKKAGKIGIEPRPYSIFRLMTAGLLVLLMMGAAAAGYWFYDATQRAKLADMQQAELTALNEKLEQAHYDRPAVEEFLRSCSESNYCTSVMKEEARARLDLITAESRTYETAQGDADRLRAYLRGCRACNFKSDAEKQVSVIEAEKQEKARLAAGSQVASEASLYETAMNCMRMASASSCDIDFCVAPYRSKIGFENRYPALRAEYFRLRERCTGPTSASTTTPAQAANTRTALENSLYQTALDCMRAASPSSCDIDYCVAPYRSTIGFEDRYPALRAEYFKLRERCTPRR
jgi:serine/threonine protein kinase